MVKSAGEFYSLIPEKMEEKYSEENLPEPFVEFRRKFVELVGSGRILDAGCGPGRDCEFFMENGFEAVGIDVAEGMIEYARGNRKGEFHVMDMRSLDFEDSSFNGLWCSASIFFIPKEEIKGVLAEFSRVMKENGVIYLNFKVGKGELVKEKWGEKVKEYHLGREEVEKMLQESGFEILEYRTNQAVQILQIVVRMYMRE